MTAIHPVVEDSRKALMANWALRYIAQQLRYDTAQSRAAAQQLRARAHTLRRERTRLRGAVLGLGARRRAREEA
jgi:hypothetical protein